MQNGANWRADSVAAFDLPLRCDELTQTLRVHPDRSGQVTVTLGSQKHLVRIIDFKDGKLRFEIDGVTRTAVAVIPRWMAPNSIWQTTLIGRSEIWPVHQKTADMGGMLRTGLEDTFYLANGERASGNGELITALAACARNAGRSVASPAEARLLLGLAH